MGPRPKCQGPEGHPRANPRTQHPGLYRGPDLHCGPDHDSMTQRSTHEPDLPPGPRPPSGALTSIRGPIPLSQDPDLHAGPRPPSQNQTLIRGPDLHGRTPISMADSALHPGPWPTFRYLILGPTPSSRGPHPHPGAETCIQGPGPPCKDQTLLEGLTFIAGPLFSWRDSDLPLER